MQAHIGTILLFAGREAPEGWAFCHNQLLSIDAHPKLFAAIGTTYGGDGRVTFALPDLRGRVPVGAGKGPGLESRELGTRAGAQRHFPTEKGASPPAGHERNEDGPHMFRGKADDNMPPFTVLNYIIALDNPTL